MNGWTIRYKNSAVKDLSRLPKDVVERERAAIQPLAENPYPVGCKKMRGKQSTYRFRIGDYRVFSKSRKKQW